MLLETAQDVMSKVRGEIPKKYYDKELLRAHALMKQALPSYFTAATPLDPTMRVEARWLAGRQLQGLLASHEAFRAEFETLAKTELATGTLEERRLRLRQYPATKAAQNVLTDLLTDARKRKGLERATLMWQLEDMARLYGLESPKDLAATTRPAGQAAGMPLAMPIGPDGGRRLEFDPPDPENTVHLLLEQHGETAGNEHLVFLGGRARKRLDNKFVLTCYDVSGEAKPAASDTGETPAASNIRWEAKDIRLKGKGDEAGFEEVFQFRNVVVTHGLYDVLAFDRANGDVVWRYRVPFDFEIAYATKFKDLLVLSSETQTIALYLPTGEVAWEAKETGELYYPPFVVDDRLVTVRHRPSGVTARKVTTGRLIAYLELPDVTQNRDHPLLPEGDEAYPVHEDDGLIVVTDSYYYIVVDAREMTIKWKRLIDESDPTVDPKMRLRVFRGDEGTAYLWVLKKDFDQNAMWVLNALTGDVLWHTDPKNPKANQPMYSPVFDGTTIYGVVVTDANKFHILGFDAATGKKVCAWSSKAYAVRPTVELDDRVVGDHLLARVAEEQAFSLVVFDTKAKKSVHTLALKGHGPYGVHGRVSYTVQGGYLAMLVMKHLTIDGPG
jgi:hypothetical protein